MVDDHVARGRSVGNDVVVARISLDVRQRFELGVVGAARRHRGVVFEPFFRDEVILVCPPDHRFAGRTVKVDELKREPLILMQEGAGVRQVIEDELRRVGVRMDIRQLEYNALLQQAKEGGAESRGVEALLMAFLSGIRTDDAFAKARIEKRAARQARYTARVWAKRVVDNHQLIAVEDLRLKFLAASTM